MADYDHTNKGVAFFNDKKEKDNQPDYRGKGNFNGVDFELALWARESKDGKEYFSISFSKPYVKQEGGAWEQQRQKFAAKKDVAPTDVEDEVDLDEDFIKSIPF